MKKIAIIGSSGSGKTTLAKLLAQLSIPVYHLDQYFWQPHWRETSHDRFVIKQNELVSQDKWIIDGSFRRTLSIRLSSADTIIFLDISRWRCLYNVIKRQWKYRGSNRTDIPGDALPALI